MVGEVEPLKALESEATRGRVTPPRNANDAAEAQRPGARSQTRPSGFVLPTSVSSFILRIAFPSWMPPAKSPPGELSLTLQPPGFSV